MKLLQEIGEKLLQRTTYGGDVYEEIEEALEKAGINLSEFADEVVLKILEGQRFNLLEEALNKILEEAEEETGLDLSGIEIVDYPQLFHASDFRIEWIKDEMEEYGVSREDSKALDFILSKIEQGNRPKIKP